jgi:hypothetical protein
MISNPSNLPILLTILSLPVFHVNILFSASVEETTLETSNSHFVSIHRNKMRIATKMLRFT